MAYERAVIIKGEMKDLSDVLRIARSQGKKIFNCKKVKVNPKVFYNEDGNEIIVKVSPERESNEN